MSRSRLYGYREADRRTFDFACGLMRDWERTVAGQTLWKHVEGVDKDVRTMLADDEAEICLYVAQDTTRARNIFYEAVHDYRRGLSRARTWRLRVLWVPNDFKVDREDDRASIVSLLEEELTRDVLLNIVLGNISAEHIGLLTRSTGILSRHCATGRDSVQRIHQHLRDSPSTSCQLWSGPRADRATARLWILGAA